VRSRGREAAFGRHACVLAGKNFRVTSCLFNPGARSLRNPARSVAEDESLPSAVARFQRHGMPVAA